MTDIKRIDTREALVALARQLGVRPDWHEPDEQGVSALVSGHTFDNAGFWGVNGTTADFPSAYQELWVTVTRESPTGERIPVAEVNLAMLFAWATGYGAEPAPATRTTVTEETLKITIR
jgi:hypothetical protein